MRSRSLLFNAIFALATLLAIGHAAASTTEFTFSYSGLGGLASGSGTLLGTDLGGGNYLITSGSGTSTEAGALTLEGAGTYTNTMTPTDNLTSDNDLYTTSVPVLSGDGLVFSGAGLDPTSQFFNIWGNGNGSYTYFNNYDAFPYNSFTLDSFTIAAVPLPTSLLLLASAVGLMGFLVRRKGRRTASGGALTA